MGAKYRYLMVVLIFMCVAVLGGTTNVCCLDTNIIGQLFGYQNTWGQQTVSGELFDWGMPAVPSPQFVDGYMSPIMSEPWLPSPISEGMGWEATLPFEFTSEQSQACFWCGMGPQSWAAITVGKEYALPGTWGGGFGTGSGPQSWAAVTVGKEYALPGTWGGGFGTGSGPGMP